MNDFIVTAYAASNVGKKRQNNEDDYYINQTTVHSQTVVHSDLYKGTDFLGSVCDGMGGEASGEVASQITVETIGQFEYKLKESGFSDETINELVNTANDKVCQKIVQEKKRMGTTFTLLGVQDDVVTIANVGDSRIYQYSNGVLKQVSHDHTEAQTMVDSGLISQEEAMALKEKHRLTQHIGIFPYEMIIEPYIVRTDAKANDRYLLCSDGLTDMLSKAEILSVMEKDLPLEETGGLLIDSALRNGGKDNVTVLLCDIYKKRGARHKYGKRKASVKNPAKAEKIQTVSASKKTYENKKVSFLKSIVIVVLTILFIFCALFCFMMKKASNGKTSKPVQSGHVNTTEAKNKS